MMLTLPMLFTACLLSRWLFAVQCALILPVLMLTPAQVYRSDQEWVAQLCWNAFALILTGVAILAIRHQAERALVRSLELSNTDPLTGLANRRFLLDQADPFVATASRLNQEVAAMVIDLDHFKAVNDDYGHAAGDTVLVTVADALRKVVRVNDIAARTGGEEILVLAYVDDAAHAEALADRLHVTVGGLSISVGERVVQPKCSIGVAVARPGPLDGSEALWALIADADTALFAAKREGRNRWRRARRLDGHALPAVSDDAVRVTPELSERH
jgi:diguanylate cyclase (GGDEF)-like protein